MKRSAADVSLALRDRHARRETFTSIFETGEAPDIDFAYVVQEGYAAHLCRDESADVVGYKIGLTTPRMQQLCGVGEPISGAVLSRRLLKSGASVKQANYVRLGVESEIAVRVGAGIMEAVHSNTAPPLDVLVDAVCADFELIEDSAADYKKLSAISMVADNSWNAGLVLGPSVPMSELKTLKDREGSLARNGRYVDKGNSNDVLGDPVNALIWLAKNLHKRGKALKPGEWVSTGSIVPTVFVKPGERYQFTVAGLPPVEVEIV